MIALLIAGSLSLAFSLLLTPLFVRGFRSLHWGQFIRDDGPQSHHAKRGTPTMGGLIFISGAVISYLLAHAFTGTSPSASGMLAVLMTVGLGAVGFIDDYLKTRKQQSLGLGGWAKIAGQVVVAIAFTLLGIQFANAEQLTPVSTHISFVRDLPFDFLSLGTFTGITLLTLWVIVIVTSASNSVNVTDGLDGLATGSSILAIAAYALIAFWQFNQSCARGLEPGCYDVRDPLDLAVFAGAMIGGLAGFLWWNTNPALVYMGDTGSLGLGGAIAALAILTRTELLLVLIGGLFVIESGSVIVQRIYFKLTRGKRIFLMSPIHHHFELKGWAETTVVVRFWLIAGFFVMIALGALYAEWTFRQ